MANPTLTPFPTPPLPEQDEVTFNRNAANSLLAQANFVNEGNAMITWMGQQVTDVNTYKGQAATSAASAAQSVTDAANQVTLATTQANNAKTYADNAMGYRDSAQTAAAAAQAAAGLPSISGKADFMLSVNSAGNGVEWRAAVPRPTAGTAGYAVVVNPAGNGFVAQMIPISPITKYYEGAPQTIAANGSFSVSHGLGVVPKGVTAYLVCQTDFGGYVAGDRIEWPISQQARSGSGNDPSCGGSVSFNATSLSMKFGLGGGPLIIRKDIGGLGDAAPNFKIVLRAFA